MPHPSDPTEPAETRAYLERIAALLGRPVDAFLRTDGAGRDEIELARLWSAIEDEGKRAQVLAYLRALLAEGDRGG